MMNIGYNPTFGNKDRTIEVNIFEFDRYYQLVKQSFI